MKADLNTSVPFETAKRLLELGYPPNIYEDSSAYATVDYTHHYWIGGKKKIKAGEWVMGSEIDDAPEDTLIPAPTYAEAIDWLIENGYMDIDWDFEKAVDDAIK